MDKRIWWIAPLAIALGASCCATVRAADQDWFPPNAVVVPSTTLDAPEKWDADDYETPARFSTGIATSDDLVRKFGGVHYRMNNCHDTDSDVVVTVNRLDDGAFDRPVAEVVRRAAIFARERCPQAPYVVNFVAIDHDGDREFVLSNLSLISYGQDFRYTRLGQYYSQNWWGHGVRYLGYILGYIMLAAFLVWLVTKWEFFVRWYYMLTPHPAASMVHSAVNAGVEIDGEAFNAILRPIPGALVGKEVRAKQAAELQALARRSREQLQQKANELKRKLREEAAYQAAQRDLHDETIEQQLVAIRADALAKVHAFVQRGRRT